MSWLAAICAALLTAAGVAVSRARLLSVRAICLPGVGASLEALGTVNDVTLAAAAASAQDPRTAEFLGELGVESSFPHREAMVNEALRDLDGRLRQGGTVPKAAARASVCAGSAASLLGLSNYLAVPDSPTWPIGAALAVGLVGGLLCTLLGGRAEELAVEERRRIHRLRQKLNRWIAAGAPG